MRLQQSHLSDHTVIAAYTCNPMSCLMHSQQDKQPAAAHMVFDIECVQMLHILRAGPNKTLQDDVTPAVYGMQHFATMPQKCAAPLDLVKCVLKQQTRYASKQSD